MVDLDALPDEIDQGQARPGSEILQMADGSMAIAIRRTGGISGDHIINAISGFDRWTNEPIVTITFDEDGAKKLAQVTRENVSKPMAIVLDGKVISAPNINEPILGGALQVSGGFTVGSAHELAIMLRSGSLPVPFVVLEEREAE